MKTVWALSTLFKRLAESMERFHWVQHRCRQLLQCDSSRGRYSAAETLPSQISFDANGRPSERVSANRRTVNARNRPHLQENSAISNQYKGNAIRTTKYSLLTFIPMNLFQQFHRSVFCITFSYFGLVLTVGLMVQWWGLSLPVTRLVLVTVCLYAYSVFLSPFFVCLRAANVYFVFLALLNWVPAVEAFQAEITMIPVLVVLVVIAVKDALEDYRRYLFDKKVNNNKVQVFCRWVNIPWLTC